MIKKVIGVIAAHINQAVTNMKGYSKVIAGL